MCFRKKHPESPAIVKSVIIHQLQTEELRHSYDGITRFGAAYSIKFKEKEDTAMVEKLKAYRDELLAKAEELKAADINAEIEAKVDEYRAELIAKANADLDKALLKINSDVECINGLIEREEAAAAEAVETVVEPVPEEIVE